MSQRADGDPDADPGPRPAPTRDPGLPGPLLAGPRPAGHASQRRRSPLRRAAYAVLARVLLGVVRAVWWTARVRVVHGAERLDALRASGEPWVLCCWHGELVPVSLFATELLRRWGTPLAFMVSPSIDGDLAARVVELSGGRVVRGSATRSGVKVLRDLYRLMRKEAVVPLVLPDGPVGPRHECKPGGILLGQLASAPVVAFACGARPALRLGTWDRAILPLPFARVAIAVGEPRGVAADADLDRETAALQAELLALGERCRGGRS